MAKGTKKASGPGPGPKKRKKGVAGPTAASKKRKKGVAGPAAAPKKRKKGVAAPAAAPKKRKKGVAAPTAATTKPSLPLPLPEASSGVLDRLWDVVMERRNADPSVSHSARLLARGTTKVAQKFGEEAVECLIEAVARDRGALIGESADVLYHLIVLWVDAGIRPEEIWAELTRREGVSGITEKASRTRTLPLAFGLRTTKIP